MKTATLVSIDLKDKKRKITGGYAGKVSRRRAQPS
jgi:hypothetical protein